MMMPNDCVHGIHGTGIHERCYRCSSSTIIASITFNVRIGISGRGVSKLSWLRMVLGLLHIIAVVICVFGI